MKFNEQSDYDYSEGETSEDMKLQGNSLLNNKSSSSFSSQFSFRQPIDKQLEDVDINFSGKIAQTCFSFLNTLDKIAELRKDKRFSDPDPEPIECVILNMLRPFQYKVIESDYFNSRPPIFAWTLSSPTIDPKSLYAFYKTTYQNLRNQIRFVANCPPSSDRLSQISQTRRDIPTGRIIFQYIGFGYPPIDSENIYASDPLTLQPSPVKLKTIFSGIKPPSWYIFDCDNAAIVLQTFEKISKKNQEKINAVPTSPIGQATAYIRQVDWKDYYCMCATDVGEQLPIDTRLPRDLLSTILASPVPSAILFHIIHYYGASYSNPDELLSYIKNLLATESHEHTTLSAILNATIDAIAADTLPSATFTKLFRKDKTTSYLFRNFVLARFLLNDFNVHPQIYPTLPFMNRHPMWKQWTTAADLFITSTQTPRPQLSTAFFSNCLTSLQSLLKSQREDEATLPMLTVACHAPFSDTSCSNAFNLLADYASLGSNYAQKLVTPFLYSAAAQRLTEFGPEAHHIVYLLLVLAYEETKLITEVSPLSDFSKLTSAIFNTEISEETRGLVTSFLVISLDRVKSVRQVICTKTFLSSLFAAMKKSGPFLLTWMNILFAIAFFESKIDLGLISEIPMHLQISAGLRHSSFEVRASSVLALSAMLQSNDDFFNTILLMIASTAIADSSMHVRFALLIFVYKYSDCMQKSIIRYFEHQQSSFLSYNSLLEIFLGKFNLKDFKSIATAADKIARSDKINSVSSNLCIALMQVMSHDASQRISTRAAKLLQNTMKAVEGKHDYDDDEDNDEDIPSLSSQLMQATTSGLFAANLRRGRSDSVQKNRRYTRDYGAFDLATAHLQLRAECMLPSPPKSAVVVPGGLSIAVGCHEGIFRIYDETLSTFEEYKVGYVFHCCALIIKSKPAVATIADDGVISIIVPQIKKVTAQWRVEPIPPNTKDVGYVCSKGRCLYAIRGNGRITCWDPTVGLLLGEYSFTDSKSRVSCAYAHPYIDGLVIVGFENGSVRAFDTANGVESSLSLNLDGKVVSITGNNAGLVYCACENGRILVWEPKTNVMNTCGNKYTPGIAHFACHKKDPFFILSPVINRPFVCGTDLSLTHELQASIEPGSLFALSEEYPVVYFFGHMGDVHSYNLIQ